MNDATGFVELAIALGDDRLVLGHRLSEWCGHAPILEEDLALANIALDLIGQAQALLGIAAEREGRGRTADELAYFRDAVDFRNCLLVEQPNGDFAKTIARQFVFDAFDVPLTAALCSAAEPTLAGWAAKAAKESAYHLRHSREWVVRLGDGTEESHRRISDALGALWRFTEELFEGEWPPFAAVDVRTLRTSWEHEVADTLARAGLERPTEPWMMRGGRRGSHGEALGRMLGEMQIVARSFPGASW